LFAVHVVNSQNDAFGTATILANQRRVQNQGQARAAKSEITASSSSVKNYAKR
jgi:hypothetical protein